MVGMYFEVMSQFQVTQFEMTEKRLTSSTIESKQSCPTLEQVMYISPQYVKLATAGYLFKVRQSNQNLCQLCLKEVRRFI